MEEALARDVRNNSAWNQRFFVLQHEWAHAGTPPPNTAADEGASMHKRSSSGNRAKGGAAQRIWI